ncbi:hypothetical protein ACQ86O_10690 [Serratia sp. L9]|uniref:hypothetical protein n=1 Tax=Serratia sp. L9 TaxID=3423946 RepID=UPI003D668B16
MMNKLKSIARCSAIGLTLVGSLGFIQQAFALPGVPIGQCVPRDAVKDFPFSFTQSFTDPEMNVAGKTIINASAASPWTNGVGGTYFVKCGCSGAIYNESFISAIPASSNEVYSDGTKRYFAMTSNPYLAAASEVFIAGGKIKTTQCHSITKAMVGMPRRIIVMTQMGSSMKVVPRGWFTCTSGDRLSVSRPLTRHCCIFISTRKRVLAKGALLLR